MSFNPKAIAAMKAKQEQQKSGLGARLLGLQNKPNLVPQSPVPITANPLANATMPMFHAHMPALQQHIPGEMVPNPAENLQVRKFANLRKKLGGQ